VAALGKKRKKKKKKRNAVETVSRSSNAPKLARCGDEPAKSHARTRKDKFMTANERLQFQQAASAPSSIVNVVCIVPLGL
jgi:hypothetical protein